MDDTNRTKSEVMVVPEIRFTVCEDGDDHIVELEEAPEQVVGFNPDNKRHSLLTVVDTLQTLRRFSDSSLKQVKAKFKKMPSWFFKSPTHQHLTVPETSRKMSLDAGGILKSQGRNSVDPNVSLTESFNRKSVSFCMRDNVRVFEAWQSDEENNEDDDNDEDDEDILLKDQLVAADDDPEETDCSRGRSLVATFVYPGKRPTYAKNFDRNVLMLESVDITEDLCVIGNIRVNMNKLRLFQMSMKNYRSTGRVSVGASYTVDKWATKKETRAMVVNAQAHPALGGKDTRAMRFFIDCDDMETGQSIEFYIWCKDKFFPVLTTVPVGCRLRPSAKSTTKLVDVGASPIIKNYKEDNDGRNYKISCTPKLNMWAEKAAQELKNISPVIKVNKNVVA